MTILNAILVARSGSCSCRSSAAAVAGCGHLAADGDRDVAGHQGDVRKPDQIREAADLAAFEIRLLSDDFAPSSGDGEGLGWNVRYLGLSLIPMLWMAIRCAFCSSRCNPIRLRGLQVVSRRS